MLGWYAEKRNYEFWNNEILINKKFKRKLTESEISFMEQLDYDKEGNRWDKFILLLSYYYLNYAIIC